MFLDTLWQEFLKILYAEVGSRVVETWFKAITLLKWDAHERVVYLSAPNSFIREWVTAHYQPLFQQHLSRLLNVPSLRVVFSDQKESGTENKTPVEPEIVEHEKPISPARMQQHSRTSLISNHNLFETFIVGPSNNYAFAAAHAVTQSPGNLYNPLLICGGSGLGKTHLLQAIGNQIKQVNKRAHILYQTADRFINEFIAAVRADRIPHFEARYKAVDVLLMDDLQCMSNKEQTQEMFFQIFTTLQQAKKQIVCACDAPPREIPGLSERVRSRLETGLMTDIQGATYETRIAILHNKARMQKISLQDDIAHYIAARSTSSVRELEGSLIRVLAFATLTQQPITIDLVGRVLMHGKERKKQVELYQILKQVSKHFDYSINDLKSTKRTKDLANARHIAVYLMKKMTDKSLREMALFLERKDHSTILHAIAKIEKQKRSNSDTAVLIERLEKDILASC